MRGTDWRSVLGRLRPLALACLVTCLTAASAAADQPLDILDPTLRGVFVEVEISSDLSSERGPAVCRPAQRLRSSAGGRG